MIECPYCLAQIPDRATTCQFCTNPVSLLVEARAKLADAELKLANATAQIRQLTGQDPIEPIPVVKWSPRLAIFVFYAASIAAIATGSSFMMPLLLVMAALLVVVIANRDEQPNALTVAMFAFAQPLLASPVLIFKNTGEALADKVVPIVRDGFVISLQMAGAATGAAFLYLMFFRRDRLKASLRLPTLTEATAGADRIIKSIALIASGLTTVTALVSAAVKLLSKEGGT